MPDYTKPDSNTAKDRRARNNRLSDWLSESSLDVTDIFLQTDDSKKTTWVIVERNGTTHYLANES